MSEESVKVMSSETPIWDSLQEDGERVLLSWFALRATIMRSSPASVANGAELAMADTYKSLNHFCSNHFVGEAEFGKYPGFQIKSLRVLEHLRCLISKGHVLADTVVPEDMETNECIYKRYPEPIHLRASTEAIAEFQLNFALVFADRNDKDKFQKIKSLAGASGFFKFWPPEASDFHPSGADAPLLLEPEDKKAALYGVGVRADDGDVPNEDEELERQERIDSLLGDQDGEK